MNSSTSLIQSLIPIAAAAGEAIVKVRSGTWTVQTKTDESPLTEADLAANAILVDGISQLSADPIISEESPERAYKGNRFWLVDPLDGTRDFVAGRDTFVICLALIENSQPILSLIHAPVTKETWYAEKGRGAFSISHPGAPPVRLIHPLPKRKPIALGSRSMPSERAKTLYEIFGIEEVIRFGSAMKFCRIAEGAFDVYPRFGPTSEWDTAAGQLICEEAGCLVISLHTGTSLRYGKPNFLNEGFIAARGDLDISHLLNELRSRGLIS